MTTMMTNESVAYPCGHPVPETGPVTIWRFGFCVAVRCGTCRVGWNVVHPEEQAKQPVVEGAVIDVDHPLPPEAAPSPGPPGYSPSPGVWVQSNQS